MYGEYAAIDNPTNKCAERARNGGWRVVQHATWPCRLAQKIELVRRGRREAVN